MLPSLTQQRRLSIVNIIMFALSTIPTCAFQLQPVAVAPSYPGFSIANVLVGKSATSRLMGESIRSRKRVLCASLESQQEEEVELYNENGEEIDIEINLETIEDNIDEYYSFLESAGEGGEGMDNDDGDSKLKKKLIECTATITLPFSEDVAFDAFSDLTRQPSWCKYLYDVEYLGLLDEAESEATTENNIPLRKSKWTVGIKGLRFSWTAKDVKIIRPNRIEWESTSGLKNMGSVEFIQQNSSASSATTTQMTMCFTFVAPRVVSSLFRRSGKVRKYTEDVIMMGMLTDFRDVVMEEDL